MKIHKFSQEAKWVAIDFARKGLSGADGTPLPDGLSLTTFNEIRDNLRWFRVMVRSQKARMR